MKFSVIIPIYNAEKVLKESIESVLRQSFQDFELILINDGSKDNSLEICTKYAQNNKRIKVINTPNGGVSRARNLGIDNAKGEYICFLDADDKVRKDWLSKFASNTNAELLCCGFAKYHMHNEEIRNFQSDNFYTGDKIYDAVNKMISIGALNPPWSKCYKASIIQQHNLRFWEGCHLYEDLIFSLQFLQHTHSIQLLSYVGYEYCLDNSNLTLKFNIPEDFLSWSKRAINEALIFVDKNDKSIVFKAISEHQFLLTSYFILAYYPKIIKKTRYDFCSYLSYLKRYTKIRRLPNNRWIFYLLKTPFTIFDRLLYQEHKLYMTVKSSRK